MESQISSKVIHGLSRSLGNRFSSLAHHPEVAMRMDAFIEFVNKHGHRLSPQKALTRFRASLGEVALYRAMALSQNGLEDVLHHGIQPSERLSNTNKHISDIVEERINSIHLDSSPLISVSYHKEVALAATKPYLSDEKELYLFKIQIPRWKLLWIDEDWIERPPDTPRSVSLFWTSKPISESVIHYFDEYYESFVFTDIRASQIIEYEKIEAKEAPYFLPLPF